MAIKQIESKMKLFISCLVTVIVCSCSALNIEYTILPSSHKQAIGIRLASDIKVFLDNSSILVENNKRIIELLRLKQNEIYKSCFTNFKGYITIITSIDNDNNIYVFKYIERTDFSDIIDNITLFNTINIGQKTVLIVNIYNDKLTLSCTDEKDIYVFTNDNSLVARTKFNNKQYYQRCKNQIIGLSENEIHYYQLDSNRITLIDTIQTNKSFNFAPKLFSITGYNDSDHIWLVNKNKYYLFNVDTKTFVYSLTLDGVKNVSQNDIFTTNKGYVAIEWNGNFNNRYDGFIGDCYTLFNMPLDILDFIHLIVAKKDGKYFPYIVHVDRDKSKDDLYIKQISLPPIDEPIISGYIDTDIDETVHLMTGNSEYTMKKSDYLKFNVEFFKMDNIKSETLKD